MDDRFMNSLRREPDPGFARRLQTRLREQGAARTAWSLRPAPAIVVAFAALAAVSLFAFPAVRASAQAMLDLFRVRRFAAVPFDETRIERLKALKEGESGALMVFDKQETLQEPGPPRYYSDAATAAAAAGLPWVRPTTLPNGLEPDSVFVQGEGAGRLSVSEQKLRALLDALEIRDVSVPMGLDGTTLEVRKPPAVIQHFRKGRFKAALLQSRSPELSVPAGLDIERLAEIGLRVLGLDPAEARRIARGTDWRGTLLVPVPLNAGTFRQVTVHGQPGLLVTTVSHGDDGSTRRDGSMVMWTEGDQVFAVVGNLGPTDTMEMAESVR